ncbi:hypothetical protein [Marinicellulosiphila megalodicopiae]|uniref:hypothetical protein n=1 Tax=Marinicellulosiphila megalodicopiae TaxID=2724896 RepID=UPI003BB102E8
MEKPIKPNFYYSIHVMYSLIALAIFIYSKTIFYSIYPQGWFVLVGRLITLMLLLSVYSTLFMNYKQQKDRYINGNIDQK